MTLQLTSSTFSHMGAMPIETTCEGADRSPALAWTSAPGGTRSFALVCDDPDAPDPAAPRMVYVHWVLYNLPANCAALPAAVSALPEGSKEGLNDWKRLGYGGPCPPIGRHRYFFKLYALDVVLPDLAQPSKAELLKAIEGHVLEKAELVGTYEKRKK